VEYWDGESTDQPTYDASYGMSTVPDTQTIEGVYIPKPSKSGNIIVGPNTPNALGLTLSQAIAFHRRIKRLKGRYYGRTSSDLVDGISWNYTVFDSAGNSIVKDATEYDFWNGRCRVSYPDYGDTDPEYFFPVHTFGAYEPGKNSLDEGAHPAFQKITSAATTRVLIPFYPVAFFDGLYWYNLQFGVGLADYEMDFSYGPLDDKHPDDIVQKGWTWRAVGQSTGWGIGNVGMTTVYDQQPLTLSICGVDIKPKLVAYQHDETGDDGGDNSPAPPSLAMPALPSITLETAEFWPYADGNGKVLWDKDSGAWVG